MLICILANKCDQEKLRVISSAQLEEVAVRLKIPWWFEISGLTGENILEAFIAMTREALKRKLMRENQIEEGPGLMSSNTHSGSESARGRCWWWTRNTNLFVNGEFSVLWKQILTLKFVGELTSKIIAWEMRLSLLHWIRNFLLLATFSTQT